MVSSLQFSNEEKNRKRFSNEYPDYAALFVNYSNDSTLHLKPDFNDFYIRPTQPSRLDIVIIVYVIGKKRRVRYSKYLNNISLIQFLFCLI